MWKARLRRNQKKGFTLVEMMVAIGIIAVLVGIAIPGVIAIRNSLEFKKMNDYAKEVFLAAQNTLVERNAAGTLDDLRADDDGNLPYGAAAVPEVDNALFPAEDWSAQYCYTTTGTDAFELLLPAGSIDETVRSQNILVEYNPYTGNVYSVFYSESNALDYSNVFRDKTNRRKIMLGYYQGSGLSGGEALRDLTEPVVDLTTKGQEAILTVSVPIPDNYLVNTHTFADAMRVSAKIEGELFDDDPNLDGEFEITAEQFEDTKTKTVITGNTVQIGFVLDSLKNQGSFASLAQNNPNPVTPGARNLGNIKDATSFNILPGDNVKITVSITVDGLPDVIEYSDVIVSGLNPMFGAVQEVTVDGEKMYEIYLENGRHLQNLNAIAPQIADKVKSVFFSEDIYWNETQDYYTNKYVTQTGVGQNSAYTNSKEELPGRGLPYFVPITSPNLFGSAYFDTNRNDIIFSWGVDVPVLTDTDSRPGEGAEIYGGKHKVLYLDINAGETNIVKDGYYAYKNASNGMIADVGKDRFTGLFSYCESNISSLYVVNSTIIGTNANGTSATGGMVGACGPYAFLYDCGIYIDTEDPYFSRANMNSYRVEGKNAVGGLVGYAKTHKSVTGQLMTNSEDVLAFSQCFAAVPVRGGMVEDDITTVAYGYTNGVGGIVGVSILSNFYNCYASGDVYGTGAYTPDELSQILGKFFDINGIWSRGVGGFVGTSHGTHYKNCFVTGDVTGTSMNALNLNKNGAGGFIGVAFLDEKFTYGPEGNQHTVAQSTKFYSCYSSGVSELLNKSRNGNSENFCGRMLAFTDNGGLQSVLTDFFAEFFDISAGNYYTIGKYYPFTTFVSSVSFELKDYIYKDSYYLNQYVEVGNNQNYQSNLCAQVVQYQDLQDLQDYQADLRKNAQDDDPTGRYLTLDEQKRKYIHDRADDFLGGFHYSNWGSATADTTHPYSLGIGSTYPFTKLNGMDYYGDWPSYLPNLALAYYEEYEGETVKGYYLDRDRTSTLKNGKEGDRTYKVVGDGYAIMCSGTVNQVIINGTEYGRTQILKDPYSRTIGNVSYNVYELKPEAMKAAAEDTVGAEEFYSKLKINTTLKGETNTTTFTVYFNPRFALTQVNPNVASNGVQKHDATKPESKPSQIYIRSARQLREIGLDAKYWGADYHYAQLVDIDAGAYKWQTYVYLNEGETFTFKPIGSVTEETKGDVTETVETAFLGSYNGGTGYVKSARISNVDLNMKDQLAYGLFGLIGKTGSVSSVTVDVDKAPASTTETNPTTSIQLRTSVENMGMLAGVNRGKISAVTIAADNALTVTAQEAATIGNFGMLAGLNNGSITGCAVNAAKPIQADVTNAMGGLVGVNAAAESDPAAFGSIDGCTVTIDTIKNTNASTEGFTGGIIGKLESGTFKAVVPTASAEPGASDESVEATVSITIGSVSGEGYVGGFAGFASGNPGSIEAVEITDVTGAAAGGVIGKAEDLTLSGSDVTVKGQVAGQTYAGGFAAQITKTEDSGASELKNCNVTLMGSVTTPDGIDGGTAAGFAAVLDGSVMDSGVFCRSSEKVTISGTNAAGFAGEADLVRGSSFSGEAEIVGSANAAGFANEITQAQGNVVAPVLMDSEDLAKDFREGSNANLKVAAPNAAGFVNTVPDGANVRENAALGTITGTNAAGFVGSNNGTISACMANVVVSGGVGFAAENNSSVEACYVWYSGVSVKHSFASVNTGTIQGCYAAPLGAVAPFAPEDSTGTFTSCYNVCAEEDITESLIVQNIGFEDMSTVGPDKLGGKELGWATANVAKKYPYDEKLSSMPYGFPMLLKVPQYGDWKNGPIYAYGVVYYEEYDDGLHYEIVELSNPSITEEGTAMSWSSLTDSESDVDKVVTKYGYGVFYRKSSQITLKQGETVINLEAVDDLTKPTGEGSEVFENYVFKKISEDASCTAGAKVITITGANGLVEVNPYFANAIKLEDSETSELLHIHAPQQLQNVAGFPDKDFVICRNLDMRKLDDFTAISGFKGSLTAPNGAEITGFTGGSLFGSVAKGAKISNLTLDNFNTTGSLFGTVSGAEISNLSLENISTKSLFTSVTNGAEISNLSLKTVTAGDSLFGTVDNATIRGATVVKAEVTITDSQSQSAAGLFANTITGSSIIQDCQILGLESEDTTIEPSTLTVIGKNANIPVGILAGQVEKTTDKGATIDGVAIENVEVSFTQSESAEAYIGGIVGRMAGGTMTDCYAGTVEDRIALTVDTVGNAYVGGAVGWADDGSYTGSSAVADIVEVNKPTTAGQFVGYIVKGAFEDCSGGENSDREFLGGIRITPFTLTESCYKYNGKSTDDPIYALKTGEKYKDFDVVSVGEELIHYEAVLDTCSFLKNNDYYLQEISTSYYYNLVKDTNTQLYDGDELKVEYNGPSSKKIETLGSNDWNKTPTKINDYYVKDGSSYYQAYGRQYNYNRNRYDVGHMNGGEFKGIYTYRKESDSVQLYTLNTHLEPGNQYLICSGDMVLSSDNGFETKELGEPGSWNLEPRFMLKPFENDKIRIDGVDCTVTVADKNYEITVKGVSHNVVVNKLKPGATQTTGIFSKTTDIYYEEIIERLATEAATLDLDPDESQFALRPTEPETEPTEEETEPTEEETEPTEEETKPTEEETKPTEEETKPTEEETKPTEEETKPTEEETKPTEEETKPTEEESEPTEEVSEPTEEETEPKETKTAEGDTPPTPEPVGDSPELENT